MKLKRKKVTLQDFESLKENLNVLGYLTNLEENDEFILYEWRPITQHRSTYSEFSIDLYIKSQKKLISGILAIKKSPYTLAKALNEYVQIKFNNGSLFEYKIIYEEESDE